MMIAELPLLADYRAAEIIRANENTINTYKIPWATIYLKCSTQLRDRAE